MRLKNFPLIMGIILSFTYFTGVLFSENKKQFEWAAAPVYDSAWPVSEGLARVASKIRSEESGVTYIRERYGFINTSGEMVIAQKYTWAGDFEDGHAWAIISSPKVGRLDKSGNFELTNSPVNKTLNWTGIYSYKGENGKWGLVKKEDAGLYSTIIEPKFDQIFDQNDGFNIVLLNGKYGFVSGDGRIIEPQFEEVYDFSEGMAAVKTGGKWGFIDRNGKPIVSEQFDSTSEFHEGRALVEINGMWGFIDRKGKMVIKPEFQDALWFNEGFAPVKINGKWGFIDKNGEVAIDPQFDKSIDGFIDGIALVQVNGKYGYIKKPAQGKGDVEEIGAFGAQVARVSSVRGKEILIAGSNLSDKIFMGAWYIVDTGKKRIFIEATFPMMTTAKCRVAAGDISEIKPGMKVYRKPKRTKSE